MKWTEDQVAEFAREKGRWPVVALAAVIAGDEQIECPDHRGHVWGVDAGRWRCRRCGEISMAPHVVLTASARRCNRVPPVPAPYAPPDEIVTRHDGTPVGVIRRTVDPDPPVTTHRDMSTLAVEVDGTRIDVAHRSFVGVTMNAAEVARRAAELGLSVGYEDHGAGAGITLFTLYRGDDVVFIGRAEEVSGFCAGYITAVVEAATGVVTATVHRGGGDA